MLTQDDELNAVQIVVRHRSIKRSSDGRSRKPVHADHRRQPSKSTGQLVCRRFPLGPKPLQIHFQLDEVESSHLLRFQQLSRVFGGLLGEPDQVVEDLHAALEHYCSTSK
jgi:hypothetical protein